MSCVQVYCLEDYCELHAPKCHKCDKTIFTLDEETGIIVRIQVGGTVMTGSWWLGCCRPWTETTTSSASPVTSAAASCQTRLARGEALILTSCYDMTHNML